MVAQKKDTRKKAQTSKRKSSSKKPSTPSLQKDSVFVIMPFSGWFDDYYSTIFDPAIRAAGLEPHRADDLYRPSTIVSDIWSYTREAKLILADLSGKNPNVFYELGLAHALAKPAILIVETMDDVPFDLRALRILEYDKNDPNWGQILQEKIEKAIEEVLVAPQQSVPAAFLETSPAKPDTTLTPHDKEMLEVRQELDILRRQVRDRPSRAIQYTPPSEARSLIDRYLEAKLPESIIFERLRARGVPERWVSTTIKERLQPSTNKTLAQDPETDSVRSANLESVAATSSTRTAAKKTAAKKTAAKKTAAKKTAAKKTAKKRKPPKNNAVSRKKPTSKKTK